MQLCIRAKHFHLRLRLLLTFTLAMLLSASTSFGPCLAWGLPGTSRLALSSSSRPAAALAAAAAAALATSVARWAHADAHAGACPRADASSGGSSDGSSLSGSDPAGARRADSESGRSCESPDAALRDVMLSRLAALESEVAELRALTTNRRDGDSGGDGGGDGAAAAARRGGAAASALRSPEALRENEAAGAMRCGEGEGEEGQRWQHTPLPPQQQKQQQQQAGEGSAAGAGAGAEAAATDEQPSATEAVAEGLSKLHPKITRLVHSGYLESLHHLRQRLMVDEWEGGGRQRALQRGVADFEAQCTEKGLPLSWEELSQLYKAPEDLSVIRDPVLRSAARATLQRVLDERHEKVREGATQLAKELTDSVTHGPSNLISGLWGMLPLPSFLKGK
ncbi:hypothetical protein PLESTM_000339300 [Pleodorina starrii]|nr:hypothetical protein PLESTM_000339300 [Pleodorina starrii]